MFRCRSCASADIDPVLSLGELPLANSLLSEDQLDEIEPRFTLDLVCCSSCGLVQITKTVSPDVLFRKYLYFSSVSQTMLASSETLARRLVEERQLDNASLVVEIGSNDGYLLQFYQHLGIRVQGIDPALNVATVARDERDVPTIGEFFSDALAEEMASRGQRADVVHAHNVLAHVADLNGVVSGMRKLLRADGVAVIEVPYVRDLVERVEFDTIYHEHLCYFSATSLNHLFTKNDLVLQHVEHISIHGGSLRVFVGREGQADESVTELLDRERHLGMSTPGYYASLAPAVTEVKAALVSLLEELKKSGKRVAAYGAAAKGATLLGYCGLDNELIEYVVDLSQHKQGLYMPGVHLPILPPQILLETRPDFLLILAWNIADEVIQQQIVYRAGGGRFILPAPRARIIE